MSYKKRYENTKILEIGAVLPHYLQRDWDVIDKYETFEGITNEDVTEFRPRRKYNLIMSISTLEHVGFDEEIKEPNKIVLALHNLRENCLNKNGVILVTLPLGYNKHMDELLYNGELNFDESYYFKRINAKNEWVETCKNDVVETGYNKPYLFANAIFVGIVNKN
jgi:hypothetical protein